MARDGSEQVIPIPDVTRRALLAILGVVILAGILRWLGGR